MTALFIRQKQRRASAATWTTENDVLLDGEIGIEQTDDPATPDLFKVGDGVTPWNDLTYSSGAVSEVNGQTGTVSITPANIGAETPGGAQDKADAAASASIPRTLVSAKGDLVAASANDTVDRLPVGTDGQRLQADSTQPLGVRWASLAPQITRYTTPQAATVYQIPAAAKALLLRVQGSGGGGGSGRRGSTGTVRTGGSGGGGGGREEITVNVADLAVSQLYVTVGAAGVGGAAVTTDDTNGNPGTTGAVTSVRTVSSGGGISQTLAAVTGGGGGSGGGAGSAPVAGGGGLGRFPGAIGGTAPATGAVGGGAAAGTGGAGGGAGGGLTAANAASAGGAGAYPSGNWAALTLAGAAGASGVAGADPPILDRGNGGSGGGSSTGTGGGAGGTGGRASGGGGGGASENGQVAGAGGNGGDGFVEIIAYF